MTYDHYRNSSLEYSYTALSEEDYRKYRREDRAAAGAAIVLGALLLATIGGFVYYHSRTSDLNLATNEITAPMPQSSITGLAPTRETTGMSFSVPGGSKPN
jgi:hypothetical protein